MKKFYHKKAGGFNSFSGVWYFAITFEPFFTLLRL